MYEWVVVSWLVFGGDGICFGFDYDYCFDELFDFVEVF